MSTPLWHRLRAGLYETTIDRPDLEASLTLTVHREDFTGRWEWFWEMYRSDNVERGYSDVVDFDGSTAVLRSKTEAQTEALDFALRCERQPDGPLALPAA